MMEVKSYLKGNVLIDKMGIRLGDSMEIYPFQGNKRGHPLKKTKYNFFTSDVKEMKRTDTTYVFPTMPNIDTHHLQMMLVGPTKNSKDGRFLVKSIGPNPFKLNDMYTREAYITRGSILDFGYNRFVFHSTSLQKKRDLIDDFPATVIENPINILLEGETGTGKTRLAKAIHDASKFKGKFVHVHLASFSSGLIESELFGHVKGAFTGAIKNRIGAFEDADGGTLFLDEIDSLPLELQTKLLLVLESMCIRPVGSERTRQVNMRIIFASGRPLLDLVKQKIFREDFYYRVERGYYKRLLPLRESSQLLEELIFEFLEKNNLSCSPKLINYYKSLEWPGNIRQFLGHLEKKRIIMPGSHFDFDKEDELLGKRRRVPLELNQGIIPLEEMNKIYVHRVLSQTGENYTNASRLLKISLGKLKRIISS